MYKNIGNYEEVLKELYPYNLYFKSICSCDKGDYRVIDPDMLVSAVKTLSNREQDVIHRRYAVCKTYEEIGKLYNVTRERIRQIEAKALRKLRHPERRRKYEYREDPQSSNQALLNVRDLIFYFNNDGAALIRQDKTEEKVTPRDLQLKDLDLSVRSYNCLTRAGFRTLGDVVDAGEQRLMNVRGFGRRSFNEVMALLDSHGLEVKKE